MSIWDVFNPIPKYGPDPISSFAIDQSGGWEPASNPKTVGTPITPYKAWRDWQSQPGVNKADQRYQQTEQELRKKALGSGPGFNSSSYGQGGARSYGEYLAREASRSRGATGASAGGAATGQAYGSFQQGLSNARNASSKSASSSGAAGGEAYRNFLGPQGAATQGATAPWYQTQQQAPQSTSRPTYANSTEQFSGQNNGWYGINPTTGERVTQPQPAPQPAPQPGGGMTVQPSQMTPFLGSDGVLSQEELGNFLRSLGMNQDSWSAMGW